LLPGGDVAWEGEGGGVSSFIPIGIVFVLEDFVGDVGGVEEEVLGVKEAVAEA
jgi:hypothetical protein